MVVNDPNISAIPFEINGNEVLIRGLMARYTKAFRHVAAGFESKLYSEKLIDVPERRGKVRFYKSGDSIGVAYIKPSEVKSGTFTEMIGQMMREMSDERTEWNRKHNSLVQRGMNPAVVEQLKNLFNEDF
ncbi:hypothetical protein EBR96_02475 [bacterium]|nr:hypothetical protein [bacterium]